MDPMTPPSAEADKLKAELQEAIDKLARTNADARRRIDGWLAAGTRAVEGLRSLLVVDDDPLTLDLIGRLLERDGLMDHLSIDWAATGEEAERFLRTRKYNLILLDVYLPGITGPELIQQIREGRFGQPAVHIVAMSGAMGDDQIVRASVGAEPTMLLLKDPVEVFSLHLPLCVRWLI